MRRGGDVRKRSDPLALIRADPAIRRAFLLRTAWNVIGGIALISAALTILAFKLAPDLASGIGLATLVLTGATLMLGVVAAGVAVLAYAVSTGSPELVVSVRFPFSEANRPVFMAVRTEDGYLTAQSFKQLRGEIRLQNDSQYSASSPAVIVRLEQMGVIGGKESPGWVATQFANMIGVTAFQWDGGGEHPIHGNSVRTLPALNLDPLRTFGDEPPSFEIEILADGYRRTVTIKAGFSVDGKMMTPAEEHHHFRRDWR